VNTYIKLGSSDSSDAQINHIGNTTSSHFPTRNLLDSHISILFL